MLFRICFLSFAVLLFSACSDNDGLPQQADPDFVPRNTVKSFSELNSPIVFIDEAHNNFHTANGRYKPFFQVLMSDGYTVMANKKALTYAHLKQADILVIANALDEGRSDWTPPFLDAFGTQEIQAIKKWVNEGGSLLLVVDHTPFPKASESLWRAFGFEFSHGHVANASFKVVDGSLAQHAITTLAPNVLNQTSYNTSDSSEESEANSSAYFSQIRTFGGSAFRTPQNAVSLLKLGAGTQSLVPEIPFQISSKTPRVSMQGWSQGAVLEIDEGRVAVFSEAMMFTSQVYVPTGEKMGLVSKGAEHNEAFLLNVMHWLSKAI